MASLDHVIVLMMENASFDRMLGALFPERNGGGGIKGSTANHWNDDTSANARPPTRHIMQPTKARIVTPDPSHEHKNVLSQMQGPNKGFVTDFAKVYPTTDWLQRQEIMGYYEDGALPVLHTLAKEYTVCDRWFSSMPGPTWPNRVFAHTGTSLGYTTNSMGNRWDQGTIYDRLDAKHISWNIYYGDGDMSQTAVLRSRPWVDPMRYFNRVVQGPEQQFPKYCFIEPHYGIFNKNAQNDQHPLSDIFRGEALIRDVYNALRANTELWKRSLLVITYDEHGGFYDHVEPPAAVRPDNRTDGSGFQFNKLGPRVPAVLVSPWLDQGTLTETFDHTSVLKFAVEKWALDVGYLGDRVASPSTKTFAPHLRTAPRSTYGLLPTSNKPTLLPPPATMELSDNQKSMVELGHYLAADINDADLRSAMMTRPATLSPAAEAQLAVEQFRSALADQAKQPPAAALAASMLKKTSLRTSPRGNASRKKSAAKVRRKGSSKKSKVKRAKS
jgi:phospholipase C